ncbi:hypothetical protein ABID08_000004 [Rhizobium binae]|uniref:Uncharacterized protein n=1 Tax=Rhizobium binae TaxID=1138190 RepID=A0ABV2M866_9HYPH
MAAELGVRYVLEGSIRREGSQVRINVQLVDGVTAANLRADHFEDGIGGMFAFQDHVTERVASTSSRQSKSPKSRDRAGTARTASRFTILPARACRDHRRVDRKQCHCL